MKYIKLAQGAASAAALLSELQAKYPQLSVSELIRIMKKSKGDPSTAMKMVQELVASGGATAAGSPPNLQADAEAWFRYYDRDNNGLARYEVNAAITETFQGSQRESLLRMMDRSWRRFDPDGSGNIDLREFLQPNGLRDTLVACLNGSGAPSAAPAPYRPSGGDFKPPARRGRTKALLIGINYVGQRAELRGCVNDVKNLQKLLTQTYGWDPRSIRTLTDSQATCRNILAEIDRLVAGAQPGDAFVFHFSGHGSQQEDPKGMEEDGMNETIIPVDFKSSGMITDDLLLEKLVAPLPEGARLTAIMDCCHSGTGLDLPFMHTGGQTGGRQWKQEVNPFFCACDAQLFSGCEDHATSADAQTKYGAAGGAMTSALCDELKKRPNPAYTDLIIALNKNMKKNGFKQRPQLSSSQAFRFPREFSLTDAIPNTNSKLGRIQTQKFKPNPRPPLDASLAEMLGPLGGVLLAAAIPAVEAIGGKKAKAGLDLLQMALGGKF